MKKLSLKLKVTLWYTLIMALICSILLFAVTSLSRKERARDIEENLRSTVMEISMGALSPKGHLNPLPKHMLYRKGVNITIYDRSKNLAVGQVPFGIESLSVFKDSYLRAERHNGEDYLVFDRMLYNGYWIKGIVSLSVENASLGLMARNNFILALLLILFAGVGGYLIISRAFVPVNKIRETAESIAESRDLSRRIALTGEDEISKLAETFDNMLSKLSETFEKEKQFTSDASHELRTPVAVILSECEYLKECAKTPEDYEESIASVTRQAEKMNKLISELLTLSRMDKGTIRKNFKNTDLSELLGFVCDDLEEINSKSIVLHRDIDESIIANADSDLIARLFINLISNSYKYSRENGTVTVSLKMEFDKIIFTVSDNGIGIAKENLDKIWERFYQEDPSRNSKANGMGLGLSMVKWIAECHGGKVTVESTKNVGTEFKFVFPGKSSV